MLSGAWNTTTNFGRSYNFLFEPSHREDNSGSQFYIPHVVFLQSHLKIKPVHSVADRNVNIEFAYKIIHCSFVYVQFISMTQISTKKWLFPSEPLWTFWSNSGLKGLKSALAQFAIVTDSV